jgi:hypothetical protein
MFARESLPPEGSLAAPCGLLPSKELIFTIASRGRRGQIEKQGIIGSQRGAQFPQKHHL